MKILLTINKTLTNGKTKWLDGGYHNVFLPLQDLGHDVYFWDTVNPDEPNYQKVIDKFKPDLIFCCMTGDVGLTPYESNAWEVIPKETEKGNIKTFNWFCDDTWRFESFSSKVCKAFSICSTPEPEYVEKYKNIGYENIIVGGWHTNDKLYSQKQQEKKYDIVFIGQMNNPDRNRYIQYLIDNGVDIKNFHGVSHEQMTKILSESKIGINFSKNYNGTSPRTQMKLRPFEIAAAKNTLVLSEYHNGLEYFFKPDKEIVCFKNANEMLKKTKALLSNDRIRENIALSGNKRFSLEHSSHERMKHILKKINDI